MERQIWVVPIRDGWGVQREGIAALLVEPTQEEAIEIARAIAKRERLDLVILNSDGAVSRTEHPDDSDKKR